MISHNQQMGLILLLPPDLFERLRLLRGNKTMLFSSHRFGNLTRHADLILFVISYLIFPSQSVNDVVVDIWMIQWWWRKVHMTNLLCAMGSMRAFGHCKHRHFCRALDHFWVLGTSIWKTTYLLAVCFYLFTSLWPARVCAERKSWATLMNQWRSILHSHSLELAAKPQRWLQQIGRGEVHNKETRQLIFLCRVCRKKVLYITLIYLNKAKIAHPPPPL